MRRGGVWRRTRLLRGGDTGASGRGRELLLRPDGTSVPSFLRSLTSWSRPQDEFNLLAFCI